MSVRADSLNENHTTSCGCVQKERAVLACAKTEKKKSKEGMSREKLYNIWYLMLYRCKNPKSKAYHNYGERGIDVCEEWRNGLDGYKCFKNWALENGYDGVKTLDRINNDKGYSPDNCRWATLIEQGNNKRTNRWVELNGEKHTTFQWDRIAGLSPGTVSSRINRGWSAEEAITIPLGQRRTKR